MGFPDATCWSRCLTHSPRIFAEDVSSCFSDPELSLGATNDAGRQPPNVNQLRDCLADSFLGGRYKDATLAWVAELAISETDLFRVQDFVAGLEVASQF
jgi:hypothetical protein